MKRPGRHKAKGDQHDHDKAKAMRAKHRRDCITWNRNNPWYFREARIQRLLFPETGPQGAVDALGGGDARAFLDKVNWLAFRKLNGLNLALAIEEILKRAISMASPPACR